MTSTHSQLLPRRNLRRPHLLISVAACALAMTACSGIGTKLTPTEQELLQTMAASQFQSRSQEEREAVETQPLFAQAAFWSREYDLNPSDLEAALKLSSSLRKLGNPQKAAEIAQTTRAIYPRDTDLVAEYSASLIALELGKNAISPLSSAVRQDPNNPRLWSLLGAANDQIAQYNQAREYYNHALRITPNDPNVIANVGLSYALEGDARTAEVWLRRAVAHPDAGANIRQNLAIVLGLQGNYAEAEKLAREDLAPEGAENNLAYLRSMNAGSRSYDALSEPQPTSRQTSAPQTAMPQNSAPNGYQYAPNMGQMQASPNAYPAPSSSTPRTYGAAPQTYAQLAQQTQPASQQQQPSMSGYYNNAVRPAATQNHTQYPSYAPQQATPAQPQQQRPVTAQAATQPASKDILAQISQSVSSKTDPRTQMSYRQMEEAYRQQAQQQNSAAAPQAYAPNASVQTYPAQNQSYAQYAYAQQQAAAAAAQAQGYPERRSALRTRE